MKTRRSRARQVALILVASGGFLAPFVLWVWGHLEIVKTGYDIESLSERMSELEHENRSLRIERAGLQSLARIEREATKLGLMPLPLERIVVVRPRLGNDSAGGEPIITARTVAP